MLAYRFHHWQIIGPKQLSHPSAICYLLFAIPDEPKASLDRR
jgi:hypothetical protein